MIGGVFVAVVASIRNSTLDVFNRLPANEFLEPHAPSIMMAVMDCLRVDNEENALVCLRVMFEIFKNVKSQAMEVRARPRRDRTALMCFFSQDSDHIVVHVAVPSCAPASSNAPCGSWSCPGRSSSPSTTS